MAFSLGNHAVEVSVTTSLAAEDAIAAVIPWRRRSDAGAEQPAVLGLAPGTSDVLMANVTALNMTRSSCIVAFQPSAGPT